MCSHCRRVQRLHRPDIWDWVPELITRGKFSHDRDFAISVRRIIIIVDNAIHWSGSFSVCGLSASSTGTFNHILIRCSMSRSAILRATHRINSECGMVSKYFDRSASTTSV